jgi:hypothetical protein
MEQINEGVIPYNFNWRAGLNGNLKQHTYNPMEIQPTDNGQSKKNNIQFNSSLIYEIDVHVTDILLNKGKEINWQNIKSKIKTYLNVQVKQKYGDLLTKNFYEHLHQICLTQYTTNWVMLCGNYNVQDVSGSEYIFDKNTYKFHINIQRKIHFFTEIVLK